MKSRIEFCLVPFTCLFSIAVSNSNTALASGFVKGTGGHYSKFGFSSSLEKKTPRSSQAAPLAQNSVAGKVGEVTQNFSYYGEYGLGFLPWNAQVELQSAIKRVERKFVPSAAEESFSNQGFTDSSVHFKSAFPSVQTLSGVGLYSAFTVGLGLPTTSKKYRTSEVQKRSGEVQAGSEELIAPLGNGEFKPLAQLGMSATLASFWFSAFGQLASGLESETFEKNFGLQLGSGLPFNSWVQIGLQSNNKKTDSKEYGAGKFSDMQFSSGLGVSVFKIESVGSFALEGGFSRNIAGIGQKFDPYNSWNIGLSFRN